MSKLSGLVHVKHGRVGTRSEGPDYLLQTRDQDYLLLYRERQLWRPDYELEFYNRQMVEVEGELLDGRIFQVTSIKPILSANLPRQGQVSTGLGEPLQLACGQSIRLEEVGIELAFVAVEEDSRCPKGAQCIWEGRAVAAFTLVTEGGTALSFSLELRAGHPEGAVAEVGGYRVELCAVEPYPVLGQPPVPTELYVATLVVSALSC